MTSLPFTRGLARAFAWPAGVIGDLDDSVMVCRCEGVCVGDLRAVQQQSLALSAARTALLRVRAERLVQRVNLHLALGGSFEARP